MKRFTQGLRATFLSSSLLFFATGSVALFSGCASAVDRPHTPTYANGLRDVVTATDIARVGGRSAFDGIKLLRGVVAHSRDAVGNRMAPRVYVNGMETTGRDALRGIPTSFVRTIQYLRASQAAMVFGPNHPAGAIVVTTGTPDRGSGR